MLLVMDVVGDSRATKVARVINSALIDSVEVIVVLYLAICMM
jgi:hypothetical protein